MASPREEKGRGSASKPGASRRTSSASKPEGLPVSRRNSGAVNEQSSKQVRRRSSTKSVGSRRDSSIEGDKDGIAEGWSLEDDPRLMRILRPLIDQSIPLNPPPALQVAPFAHREQADVPSPARSDSEVAEVQSTGGDGSVAEPSEAEDTTPAPSERSEPRIAKRKPSSSAATNYHRYNRKPYPLYPDRFPLGLRAIAASAAEPAKTPGHPPADAVAPSTTAHAAPEEATIDLTAAMPLPSELHTGSPDALFNSETAKLSRRLSQGNEGGKAASQEEWLQAQAEEAEQAEDLQKPETLGDPAVFSPKVAKLLLSSLPPAEADRRVSVEYEASGWDPDAAEQSLEWKPLPAQEHSCSRVLREHAACQKNRAQFQIRDLVPLQELLNKFRCRPHDFLPGTDPFRPDWDAIARTAGVLRVVRGASTLGTCVLLHPEDLRVAGIKESRLSFQNVVVTARHLVLDAVAGPQGVFGLQEAALEVNLGPVKHVASWQGAGISFFRIQDTRRVHYPRFDPAGPSALRFPTGNRRFVPGEPVFLLAYPCLLDVHPWRSIDHPMDQPALLSGVVSRILHPEFCIVADYNCFPGTEGGAVLSEQGELIGIHLQEIHAVEALENLVGAERSAKGPVSMGGSPTDVPLPDKVRLIKETHIRSAPNRLERLADGYAAYAAANVRHKASLGLFVPWITIKNRLLLSHKQLSSVPGVASMTE